MPSNPTTKSQVQAYQFVLRRMQSALVRRDAVMLHDPMRTHNRATLIGVVVAILGLVGFMVVSLFSPKGNAPGAGVVIGRDTGAVYLKTDNPMMLTPVFNVASARLLQQTQQQGGQQSAPAEPTVVADSELKDIPRGRLTGIPDAPQQLPGPDLRIPNDWSVCDKTFVDPTQPDPLAPNKKETSVLAGVPQPDPGLDEHQALFGMGDDGNAYLVYKLPPSANRPNGGVVRAQVDREAGNSQVLTAMNLRNAKPRKFSMGLLNALPAAQSIIKPAIPSGQQPQFNSMGVSVGTVVSDQRTNQSQDFYVVLPQGIQKISQGTAEILRLAPGGSSSGIVPNSGLVGSAPQLTPEQPGYLRALDDYPQFVPRIVQPNEGGKQTACLSWSVGADHSATTSLHASAEPPLPKSSQGTPLEAMRVGQPSPSGSRLDYFFMPPGRGAAVQSFQGGGPDPRGKGPISLVSDRGLRYGIPDQQTAQALGLGDLQPAPESILGLLPTGASLNTQDVRRTFDSVPIDPRAGSFPPPPPPQASAGGS